MCDKQAEKAVNGRQAENTVNGRQAEEAVDVKQVKEVTEAPQKTYRNLITESHVKQALKAQQGSSAQLLSWTVTDFTNKGDNYACVVTSVDVCYHKEGNDRKTSFVVKCNPCRALSIFNEFSTAVFQKEAGYYLELLPLFNAQLSRGGCEPIRAPHCYFAHLTEQEEVIFLGDLRPEGFKMFDRMKGMDKAHAVLVLKELGKLHAASILCQKETSVVLEEKYTYIKKDFQSIIGDVDFKKMLTSEVENSAEIAERIGGYKKVVDWLKDFAPSSSDVFLEQIKKSPPFDVLCHGDCWNNNILFKYDETGVPVDVRLLDFQISRKASPATDLNYFMYTSFNGPERKDNLETFLNVYYESLREVLEAGGTKAEKTSQELREEYHKKNLFGLIMGMMVVPIVVTQAGEVMDLDDITDGDYETLVKEHRERMLKQLDSNPLLRPRLLSIFDEMLEYGVIS
ncbi:hypothetical protein OTU49_017443 [Cherax quadricarinatus]|uniref:CHK kinase-like domain-containing protein n=1 Tax=Cherax quadricarinatus TaxID=27406 RepID=A0AAW0WTV4_CHEQU